MYTIYKLTNKVNGLIYVGCTTQTLKERLSRHKSAYKRKDNDLYKAMRECGFDNFEPSVLECGEEDSIRYEREKYWISKLNSTNTDIGYNRTIGGLGTIGYKFTEEDRKKISDFLRTRPVTDKMREAFSKAWKGKHLPLEMRQKISKSRIGKYTGKDNPFYGKHHSDITKQKISEANSKPVIGVPNKGGEEIYFNSLTEASNFILGIHGGIFNTIKSHIGNSIRGINCKTAYGYTWRFVEKSNDYPDRE